MKIRRTIKKPKNQKGGFYEKKDVDRISAAFISKDAACQEQIKHCVSQLQRFAPCIQTHPLRAYQFFYNLGRLQELLGETTYPKFWWKPIEMLIVEEKYSDIPSHIDFLRDCIGVAYDKILIAGGC